MAILYKKNLVIFDHVVSVEDAEDLLQWIQKNPKGKADFSCCVHLHAATLQVLMAARLPVAVWPDDVALKAWLLVAIKN